MRCHRGAGYVIGLALVLVLGSEGCDDKGAGGEDASTPPAADSTPPAADSTPPAADSTVDIDSSTTCGPGTSWDGNSCIDIDGCAPNACFAGVTCADVPAPGTGYICGDCPGGYTGDGETCTKVECVSNVSDPTKPLVYCIPEMHDWPTGTIRQNSLDPQSRAVLVSPGYTNVYTVEYDLQSHLSGQFSFFDCEQMIFSISLYPNDFTTAWPCKVTHVGPGEAQPLSYNEQSLADWYECPLEFGKTYYINFKLQDPTLSSYYTLTLY